MTAPTLRGDGIVLRQLVVDDAPAIFIAHSDESVHRFWSGPAHADVEETRADLRQRLTYPNADAWAITTDGDEALGVLALVHTRDGVADVGIFLRREAQGRRLASRALTLVMDFAFSERGLHRLSADIDPDNDASLRLFENAGFEREGLLRGNWKTHIGIRDSIILGKLRR